MEVSQRLKQVKSLWVYNIDLFGWGIKPETATQFMGILRGAQTSEEMSQLVFARPQANLDYDSRPGYTYLNNHPLGTWFNEFYMIENGELTSLTSPIQHRK